MTKRPNNKQKPSGKPAPEQAEKPGFAARKVAADILGNVVHKKRPLDGELDITSGHSGFRALAGNDRSLVRAIIGAALRHRGEIAEILDRLLDRPIPEKTGRILDILHVAIAQMLFLDIPDRAAVSLAVDHAGLDRRARPYKGLVNGVLRRLGRERDEVTGDLDPAVLNTPDWLMESWQAAYGVETAREIARAHESEAALDLSVKADPEEWARKLDGQIVGAGSIRLVRKGAVDALEGYGDGQWWVQDAAAALPARLLGDVKGLRVADLCAAPGGKTAQLAAAGASVTAVDISKARLKRLEENMTRLGLSVETVAADLRAFEPEELFDAILLDAPCSATGTIRRHPDVPWIKKPYDIEKLTEIQSELLDRVMGWVKPGGLVVYCTCSLEAAEGEAQVAGFLERQAGKIELVPVEASEVGGLAECVTNEGYLRCLPCHSAALDPVSKGMDGFFAARFRRF
ncbi:16S rRNA (cytosine(967)-C(5))-methyltransferase RsmB [Labrenzia sp. PO1]|uniref:16S rRNA (cytosine(967)-C(5))-methyltransferase RsmB n=1 Tax=Stappiaceae TaxID=2821832 RepID=UPI001444B55E|nr:MULTISPECIES: 16S rRNA (cytosine(967)-C(5))-methyltransferase RsmB [Stappiaceae]MBO6857389.1 16S rRNA (cytosine(967)-C(5))-methyltransferase RsmB [Roseibium sp.]MBO9461632.1 16S rRNA (cytosine(967)-C(5))-methyltransferase RsmB [Labrenzia sp. R5_0]NKI60832.1 16S rRNA (cytosine(967)-C(5))-methyltransferase RsmB [Labrenzia sp. PO1]